MFLKANEGSQAMMPKFQLYRHHSTIASWLWHATGFQQTTHSTILDRHININNAHKVAQLQYNVTSS